MKKQFVYILIAGLIAFLSSFATVLYINNTPAPEKESKTDMIETMNMVYDELNLNENQVQKFNQLTGQFHRKNKKLSNEMAQNVSDYYKELSSESTDSLQLANMASANGELHKQMMNNSSWYFQQTSSFLDQNQLEKLQHIYKLAIKNINE